MQTAENVWATNGRLPYGAARMEVEAAVSTGLTAIGLAQHQKESVASNPVRSYLAQLKDDVGRKSLKTAVGLGIDVVLGFVRDALKEVPGTHCTIALDSSPRNYSRTGAPAHVTAFVVHCPFVEPEVAEFSRRSSSASLRFAWPPRRMGGVFAGWKHTRSRTVRRSCWICCCARSTSLGSSGNRSCP